MSRVRAAIDLGSQLFLLSCVGLFPVEVLDALAEHLP